MGPSCSILSRPERSEALNARAATWSDGCHTRCCALQVDVIVSEWMGYALLFESMLHSVGCTSCSGGGTGAVDVLRHTSLNARCTHFAHGGWFGLTRMLAVCGVLQS